MKGIKIAYYGSTGLLTALLLLGVGMYVFNHAEVAATFSALGYPSYLVYPLATVKMLGLLAIWTRRSDTLKEWAYAGFFFDFVLACSAHIAVGDGGFGPPVIAIVLVLVSYQTEKRL